MPKKFIIEERDRDIVINCIQNSIPKHLSVGEVNNLIGFLMGLPEQKDRPLQKKKGKKDELGEKKTTTD